MRVLYVSCVSKIKPITFGFVAMGSAVLCILRYRLLLYFAGSGVNRVQVVLSGLSVRLFYFVQENTFISGDDVCCSVVFGTLVSVFVFSVMWFELLMTSANSCPLWSSVYECQIVDCAFTSPVRTKCGKFVMHCIRYCISVSAVL